MKRALSIIAFLSLLHASPLWASSAGQRILNVGHSMIRSSQIVAGSCWDYIDAIYKRAGYPQKKRRTVYKSGKHKGPYASTDLIQSGDWLYYLNRSYNNIEHSGIFVRWVDKSKRLAEMISYKGQNSRTPARYKVYDLSNVYSIMRPNGGGVPYQSQRPRRQVLAKRTRPTPVTRPTLVTRPTQARRQPVSRRPSRQFAKTTASPAGQRILGTGRSMVNSRAIIRGACWDYVEEVYKRAGYSQNRRKNVHMGIKAGPYFNPNYLKPGDWLYYINHSYKEAEHCGIFVGWVNQSKRIAKILSYGGENRRAPGRYRNYDISHTYYVVRPI